MIWRGRLRTIQEEARWLRGFYVILPSDIVGILVSGSEDNPQALELEEAIFDVTQRVGEAPRSEPVLCLCCPRPLRPDRFAIVAVLSRRENRKRSMALAVCRKCGGTRAQVSEKAQDALRFVWPDARRIDLPIVSPEYRA